MPRLALSHVLIGAAAALAAPPAAATIMTYECHVRHTDAREVIQPLIFIAHDDDDDRVVVSDAAILGFNAGQPVEGRLVVENDARVTVAWEVDMRIGSRTVTMRYRATVVKGSHAFNVVAQPKGYSNIFSRGGRCVVKKLSE
ncbi:hypothetical protein [Pseudoponticoccus marisrubri]|uniref:Ig-like domain-containing protein n=1 Tax=Pseudoponticoccus marisrubri TaxID=1685382 RepID=A0A0W7WEF7_9RHOB|nr:hypothetical protein [Pseudoponticoccus marisrubri]KUF09024.1 hypothetical protein AVJ23_19705 [Pseudoponticoccus marisrubri]